MPTKPSTQIAQHTGTHFFCTFVVLIIISVIIIEHSMILTYETYETMCILSQKV